MDIGFEAKICRSFFNKRVRERLLYELTSKKKRGDFLCKMSHTSKLYIGNCIFSEFPMPPKADDIIAFLEDEKNGARRQQMNIKTRTIGFVNR